MDWGSLDIGHKCLKRAPAIDLMYLILDSIGSII
jgi:hypothetical protein